MNSLSAAALAHYNWLMMQRPAPPPRVPAPWSSARVHDDSCRCERCRDLEVNGEAKP